MRFLKNIAPRYFALADQALVSGSNFLLGVFLARFLGIDQYGIFAILWLVVLFALSFHQAAISKPMLSFLPQKTGKSKQIYIQGLNASQFFLSILLLLLAFAEYTMAWSRYFLEDYYSFVPLILAITALQIHHDFYRKLGFAQSQFIKILSLDIILYGIPLVGILLLFFFDILNLTNTLYCILGANTLSVLVGVFQNEFPVFNKESIQTVFEAHYSFSKWLVGTALLQWLSGNFFILTGATLLGAVAIGAIRICQNIMGLSHVLFLLMENLIPVQAAKHFQTGGSQAAISYLLKITYQTGIPFLGLMITLSFSAPYLIDFIYGETYIPYSYIIIVFSIMYLFVFISNPLRFALRTLGDTKPIFMAYVASTIFSLLAAYPFLEYWGLNGLLAGLMITQMITTTVYILYLKKYYRHADYTLSAG